MISSISEVLRLHIVQSPSRHHSQKLAFLLFDAIKLHFSASLMVESSDYQMGHSLSMLNHPRVSILLSLLLIFCSYFISFPSASLIFLVLVLSTSFSLFLPKLRKLIKANSMVPQDEEGDQGKEEEEEEEEEEGEEEEEEEDTFNINGSLKDDGLEGIDGSSNAASKNLRRIRSGSSICSVTENELSFENLQGLSDCSEDSDSDDESLIEIALSDGHYVAQEESNALELKGGYLSDFSPELLLMQHGLMELLSEINEEDNLIEIDIARGSIICPSLEIKA